MDVTNIAGGPRGINTLGGLVILDPGQTKENVEVAEAEVRASRQTGWFRFDGEAVKAADVEERRAEFSLDNLSDDELRAHLADRGVKADGRWARERLLDEARKAKA